MKIQSLLSFFLLFNFGVLFSQAVDIDTTAPPGYHTIEYIFEHLDLTQVPTGLLVDKSLPLRDLNYYNGETISDTNLVNTLNFGLIYAQLCGSAVHNNVFLPDPETFIEKTKQSDTIEIKSLYYKYNELVPWAVDSNLITIIDSQIHDVPGRTQSPYGDKEVFIALPWNNDSLSGDTFYFHMPNLGVISNDSNQIQLFEANFDDKVGWQTLQSGNYYKTIYSSAGEKTIQFRAKLVSGDTLLSHSKLNLKYPTANRYGFRNNFPIPIDGATVSGLSHCRDEQLYKPLIIIEGFNIAGVDDFDTNFRNFYIDEEGLEFESDGNDLDIVRAEVFDSGYDLVFIDFDDGTASLHDNKEVVKDVIREVNRRKALTGSIEENVVLGNSMGGVLGKLALREMEIDGEDHETRKFFSFDSPLGGANIPLGYQHMLRDLSEMDIIGNFQLPRFVPILNDVRRGLDSPAARQMLVYHHLDFPNIHNPTSQQFYQYFNSLGSLQDCEHIAISDGSEIGVGQGFPANAMILEIAGNSANVLNECTNASGFWSWVGAIGALALTGTQVGFDFEVFAVPDQSQGRRKIYKGFFEGTYWFGIVAVFSYRRVRVSGTHHIDGAPGGFIEVPEEELPCGSLVDLRQPRFCFVPTISAFHVGPSNGTTTLIDPFTEVDPFVPGSVSNPVIDRSIGVDEVINIDANTSHISFDLESSSYFLYETREENVITPNLGGRTFNFGTSEVEAYNYALNPPTPFPFKQTGHVIGQNLRINANEGLWVNRGDVIEWIDQNNPQASTNSNFDVYITPDYCEPTPVTVDVNNGGEFIIGDRSSDVKNRGKVFLRPPLLLM